MTARLLPFGRYDPAWNMAVDRVLFEGDGAPCETTLRFYGWEPHAISLGHFQGRRGEDLTPLLRTSLPVVRRMTGGGAIVHAHELTWSLALPRAHPLVAGVELSASYAVLQEPIVEVLAEFGVTVDPAPSSPQDGAGAALLCFHRKTELDLVVGGKKLAGAAQRRSRTRSLIHGSILLSAHELQPGCAPLNELLGRTVTPEEFAERLRPRFAERLGHLEPGVLGDEERERAQKLRASPTLA